MDMAYMDILTAAATHRSENEIIARQLKGYKSQDNITKLKQYHEDVFREIKCLSCANCCKTSPPLIVRSDIKRIASYLGITPRQFERNYVIEDINGEKSFSKVPCMFLQNDNTCSIYEVRPEACSRYPHTDEDDYFFRSALNVQNTLVCPAAYLILNKMKSLIERK